MHNLFNFLLRYRAWIVFIIYVVLSCVMLFSDNPYQRHVYMTSASKVSASVYDVAHSVTGYFHLRSINDDLQRRNAQLESEVIALRSMVNGLELELSSDSITVAEPLKEFDFILASVINNSITHPHNFITISKGSADGVEPEMGVVDQNGVVGVVNITGQHYSRIISLLNPDFRLSCKLKDSDVIGSLVWDGKSPREALLEELPKHTVYAPGDTIITSGYSAVFPEGIPVGVVMANERTHDDNFFTLRVKLLTDFTKLSTVRLVVSNNRDEIKELESNNIK
ncbi:MAG: rod shape-determining protein MreC [Muribaculaceae bacterium]|nr:rod shape-determining protein MreC [Bacteroides sp.]MDE7472735.1 rod shape-determining protein MreC [Muribaculaceae bacterium]